MRPGYRAALLLGSMALAGALLRSARADLRLLPHIVVRMDEQPVDIGPVAIELNDYRVPLERALSVLTHGQANLDATDPTFCKVLVGGKVVIQLPAADQSGSYAEVSPGREGEATRRVYLSAPPRRMALPGHGETMMVGLESLAGLLGIGMEVGGAQISLFTPAYWRQKLGLAGGASALPDFSLLPEMGVSPPAKTLLLWVRPPVPAFVQIYTLSEGIPVPLLGTNAFGAPVTHPRATDKPTPRAGGPQSPVRAETSFYGALGHTYGSYAAVVTRVQPSDGDALAAIRRGEIKEGDWYVVGLRQHVTPSPIRFETIALKPGQRLEEVAASARMPVSLLRTLNGLRPDDRLPLGAPVVVIAGLQEDGTRPKSAGYQVTGLYAVQPGETVASLSKRCRVTATQFLAANTALPPGTELEPGEVVNLLRPFPTSNTVRFPPPPPLGPNSLQPLEAVGKARTALEIRQHTGRGAPVLTTLPKNSLVLVVGKVPGAGLVRVTAGEITGYVRASGLDLATFPTAPSSAPPLTGGIMAAREGLKYIGTPYSWGGTDLNRGIDCSHFVAAVYARARLPVPSPPVHNMEDYGAVVHWKSGPAEIFGRAVSLGPPPSLDALQPGDRLIFQNNPYRLYDGNHHTGIYVGRLRDPRFGNMEHAVVHACSTRGVTVSDLVNSSLWRLYRFAVRGDHLRHTALANIEVDRRGVAR